MEYQGSFTLMDAIATSVGAELKHHGAFQADALPTELPRQLSWLDRVTHTKQHNSRQSILNHKIPFTVYVLTVGWCHPIKFLSISHTSVVWSCPVMNSL